MANFFEGGLGRRSLEDGKYDETKDGEQGGSKSNLKEINGKKIFKAAVVETTELLKAQARNVADRKMSETKKDREAHWFKRTLKRIWKGNLAKEVIRTKEEHKARKKILESDNLYIDDLENTNAHKQAMDSVIERFVSEYEEDTLKDEEKKSKIEVTDESIKEEIKNAIKHFAGEPTMTKEAFDADTNRILARADKGYKEKGKIYANNLFDIAKEVREAVAHGEKLSELDFDLELTLGKAQESLRTQEKLNNFQRVLEKISSTKVGAALVNETTVGIAATLYVVTSKVGTSVARKAITWGTFGAGIALSGAIAGSKEAFRLKKERAQHIRESAMGMKFEEDDMVRRQEMEKNRYETRSSKDIIGKLETDLARVQKGGIPEAELNEILANLSDVEARIRLGNKEKIDLVGYSNFSELEKERTAIDLGRARLKAALQDAQKENTIQFKNGDPKQQLEKLTETLITRLGLETAEKDRIYKKMRNEKVLKKVVSTILIGGTIGLVSQEVTAAFQGKTDGILEGTFKPSEHLAGKATVLEGARRWITGDGPRIPFGQGHEVLLGGTHLQLPEGTDLVKNPDGTFNIMHGNDVVSDHIKLGLGPNGNLDAASVKALAKEDIFTDFSQTGGKVTEHVTTTSNEYINKHPELTEKIDRIHMDNDTPMYPDPDHPGHLLGADKNELKLEWGGKGGTGINENGDYEFQVQHMTDDGSYHDGLSVAAHEQMEKGGLDVLLSVSRGTQHMVIPVHIDEAGKAIISHTSDTGKMLFENQNGHAVFEGAFAEVGHETGIAPDGDHINRILATHIGTDHANSITETIEKDTTIPNVKFNMPAPWTTVPPPFIPVVPRRSLERGEYPPTKKDFLYYMNGYGGRTTEEELALFKKMRSKTLDENPAAKLDHYKEIEAYLQKQTPEHLKRIQKLASQTEKMSKDCKVAVCIPVAGHQEDAGIYESLQNYSYQIAKPEEYELTLLVNHPEKDKDKKNLLNAEKTLKEIERFKKDYPNLNVRVMYEVLSNEEVNIGKIRKLLVDATMIRQQERGKDASDLIIISNDADNKGVSPRYVQSFIEKFKEGPSVDGMLGQLDWDPESYQKYPAIHIGTRLFQILNAIGRHRSGGMVSSGANSAFRSSIYAGIGGYSEMNGGEDIAIRKAIMAARGETSYWGFAGTGTRLFTSSRRSIDAWKSGLPPVNQWSKGEGFSVWDDEIRKLAMEGGNSIDYNNKEVQKNLKKELEAVINLTLDTYEAGETLGKNNDFYKKALALLGITYSLDERGNIIITNIDTVIKNLKKYQIEGKLIRDAKSGKKDAIEKLKVIREKESGEGPKKLQDILSDIGLETTGSSKKTEEGIVTPLKLKKTEKNILSDMKEIINELETNIRKTTGGSEEIKKLRDDLKKAEKANREEEVLKIEENIRKIEKDVRDGEIRKKMKELKEKVKGFEKENKEDEVLKTEENIRGLENLLL